MKTNLQLLVLVLLACQRAAFGQGSAALLLTDFTNPAPVTLDFFGQSVAPVGSDRVLIGANGAAKAYLYRWDGTLLTTITNPAAAATAFGWSATALGNNFLLVGAPFDETNNGAAFLFTTNGSLMTMFTNPNPATIIQLGRTVATLGDDRVVVGGLANSDIGAPYTGGVCVFGTNGVLLTTLTNPVPAHDNGFGISVATVGSDRLIVGAPADSSVKTVAGAAYLFSTNGTLLRTFTSPSPVFSGQFGTSVAAVGTDKVAIGEVQNAGSPSGGVAYLFNTSGVLQVTFTNPTPASYDFFGQSVAAVGSSLVLIGAPADDTGAQGAGAAYLFSTNGTLLTTFTNVAPADSDRFGSAVVGMESDKVIIAADQDSTGAPYAGTVYLFALPCPPLSIAQNSGTVSVKWVTTETGLVLQQTDRLGATTVWSDSTNSVFVSGQTNIVQQVLVSTNRFFRLQRP